MAKNYELIGFIAAIGSVVSYYALVYHNYILQDTTSLSFLWLFLTVALQLLWFIYGLANNIKPNMVASPLLIIGAIYLIYLKLILDTDIL